jgi:hypothetical protein
MPLKGRGEHWAGIKVACVVAFFVYFAGEFFDLLGLYGLAQGHDGIDAL